MHRNRNSKYRFWGMALLLALAGTSASQAADWRYRVRPHDNLWDLAGRYIRPDIPRQKLQDYNKVADPYHLPPGSVVRFPIAWLRVQPARAKVVAVIGDAQAQLPGTAQPVRITPQMMLGYGTHLVTDADASLTLEFADGSRVLMQHDSSLDLDRMSAYGRTGMVDTRLRLQRGSVSNSVTPMTGAAAHFSVQTPNTISSVRGTHFRVVADASMPRSRTEVLTGLVDVSGGHRHTLVPKGFGVAASDTTPPGKAQSLLPAPALACPAETITHAPFLLSWPALDGAQRYRVQIAPTPRFEALLLDQLEDAPQVALPDLPDGHYAVRVRGADENRLEGIDATCSIDISGHPAAPLLIEPQPGSQARGARPRFRWTESEQARTYVWQLASDAQFTHILEEQSRLSRGSVRAAHPLPDGHYYWRVAGRSAGGLQGNFSSPAPFELVPQLPPPQLGEPTRMRHAISFSWTEGTPGQRYHVQVDRDPAFPHPLVDQVVDKPTLQIHKPGSGKWNIRVQTIDSDGFAGPWGPTQQVKLPCIACRIGAAGAGAAALWLLL
jgi:hypothetical protein